MLSLDGSDLIPGGRQTNRTGDWTDPSTRHERKHSETSAKRVHTSVRVVQATISSGGNCPLSIPGNSSGVLLSSDHCRGDWG